MTLGDLNNLKVLTRSAPAKGKKIGVFCDRVDTLGPAPPTMEDQTNVIGHATIANMIAINEHSRGYVAIATSRRVSEDRQESGTGVFVIPGCTGNWMKRPGRDGFINTRPDSWNNCFQAMSAYVNAEIGSNAPRLDPSEGKLSLRCAHAPTTYRAAIALVQRLSKQYPWEWVVKKYSSLSLVELLPANAAKKYSICKFERLWSNRTFFIYFGNGLNFESAVSEIKAKRLGPRVRVGNERRRNSVASHKCDGYAEVRTFLDWLKTELP